MRPKFDRNGLKGALTAAKDVDKSRFTDQRFWKAETPKTGKNTYRLRVLPIITANGTGLPWVRILNHNVKGVNGFLNEKCPNTIQNPCPICEYAAPLFQTGDPNDEKKGRAYWKKKKWIANILVIKDSRNEGENEGKVFLWEFGKKIYDKFEAALFPDESTGEHELMFPDPEIGYDFFLVCKTVGQGDEAFPNYDDSYFARESTPISQSDKEIDRILSEVYDIEKEFLAQSNFKSYDELDVIFRKKIIGDNNPTPKGTDRPQTKPSQPTGAPKNSASKNDEDVPFFSEEKTTGAPLKVTDHNINDAVGKSTDSDDDFLANLEKSLK